MRIDIQAQGFALTQSIQSHVQRRIEFALDRLRGRVRRVCVRLSDVNGRRGGIDKRCQIELRTDGAGSVVVAAVASDWRSALDSALARAVRFVLRTWRRSRDPRRALPASAR